MGVGLLGRGWGEKYFRVAVARHFGVAVATYGSYKAPLATRHQLLPCLGDVYGAMTTVSGHGSPTGALQRCHSLNHDITGLTECLQEKQKN